MRKGNPLRKEGIFEACSFISDRYGLKNKETYGIISGKESERMDETQ